MATSRQSKGFIQLEWICPNCNSRNPGPKKTCENCGAPQPDNVQFYAPAEAKIIQDENVARAAKAGADIHCGFCGTRNPATATVCSQCGGDLKEGRARQAGREMQREAAGLDVKCTNCGEVNPSTRTMCAKCGSPLPRAASAGPGAPSAVGMLTPAAPVIPSAAKRTVPWIAIGAVLALCCAAMFFLFVFPSSSVEATVTDVYWQTSVPVEGIRTVNSSNEEGNPPSDAYNVSCINKDEEVCTQKTIDKGNGYAEVVEECVTKPVQYCDYSVDEWYTIQTYTLDGNDFSPVYASPDISNNQRIGDKTVNFAVYLVTTKGQKTYSPSDIVEFQKYRIGSTWKLRLNLFGGIVSIKP